MKRLESKVCILTGGSHGVGKVTCLRRAEERDEVAIPHMRSNGGGGIVNLSSIHGIVSAPDIPPRKGRCVR